MLKLLPAAIIGMVVAACASVRTPAVHVEVREITASDRWRATITQPESTDVFVFPRSRKAFRPGAWKIIDPAEGARWDIVDGHDAVALKRPAKTITLEFPSDFTLVEKDYPLHVPFTDGSRLLYTGHLRSRPRGATSAASHHWTFVTSPERPIRILSQKGIGILEWSQESSDETFVYFGSIAPEETSRMTLIVDPGMPEWVEQQMRELVPAQFTYFAHKTSTELPFKPLIVVSYAGSKGSGRTFSGNGLQGLLSVSISGEQWMPRSREAEQEWYRHLAHEVFHLWGAQAFRHEDGVEWLSEAASEYASLLVAADAGVMNEQAVRRFLANAANACISNLHATPLRDSLRPGQFRNVYTCGVVSQKLVDAAAQKAGSDIWQVWRRTFDRKRPYTTADHLEAVRAIGDSDLTNFFEELVNRGLTGNAADRFAEQLRAAGMKASVVNGRIVIDR